MTYPASDCRISLCNHLQRILLSDHPFGFLENFLRNPTAMGNGSCSPEHFLPAWLRPIIVHETTARNEPCDDYTFTSDEEFWVRARESFFSVVKLSDFIVSDWFPRSPGLYWSPNAIYTRDHVFFEQDEEHPEFGSYTDWDGKSHMIDFGGVGSVRLRPRRIDNDYCWLGTAVKEFCHAGIPLAIPEQVLADSGVEWGEKVDLIGRVRFLQDAGLDAIADTVRWTAPLIVFVEKISLRHKRGGKHTIIVTPVVLCSLDDVERSDERPYGRIGSAFVNCESSSESSIDKAVEWLELYAHKFDGTIITNFDERVPRLAGAPLSYQRLLAKTYDKPLIQRFLGDVIVQRLDRLEIKEVMMNTTSIQVGGNAIINVDTILTNVTQTIDEATGLAPNEKTDLDAMVGQIRAQLQRVGASHSAEVKEVAQSLEKAITTVSKPKEERKKPFIDLSANGLLETAKLLTGVAPQLVIEVEKLVHFLKSLV